MSTESPLRIMFRLTLSLLFFSLAGCMVGPNFRHPETPVEQDWIYSQNSHIDEDPPSITWWRVFQDPLLEELIISAYQNNLDVQIAGWRVLEARAVRGIAVGEFFPQFQQIEASHNFQKLSNNIANVPPTTKYYVNDLIFDLSWELDLWGQFRRGIAAANASLFSSIYNYDDVLVSLIADVAATYIQICLFNEQIAYTQDNIKLQEESLRITNIRYELGDTSFLDVQEAVSVLEGTKALIPLFEASRRKAENSLCILLGMTPENLDNYFSLDKFVPDMPSDIIVGTPCNLIRRRPDIRRAEALAFAQCQQIGIAMTDMLPNISLLGTFGWNADSINHLIIPSSSQVNTGIGLNWNVLNYGRLINNVRFQEAAFQESIISYQQTVLQAFQEVEDGMVDYIELQQSIKFMEQTIAALKDVVDISLTQYKLGLVDFINVLVSSEKLVLSQNQLATFRAEMALSLIATQKALGGGWEIRKPCVDIPLLQENRCQ